MKRLLLVALLVVGCGTSTPSTSAPSATPVAPAPSPMELAREAATSPVPTAQVVSFDSIANRYGVTITGPGSGRSATFDLSGDYDLRWKTSDVTCAMEPVLEFADGRRAVDHFIAPSRSGTGTLRQAPATSYVLAVTSACGWSFTFSPR